MQIKRVTRRFVLLDCTFLFTKNIGTINIVDNNNNCGMLITVSVCTTLCKQDNRAYMWPKINTKQSQRISIFRLIYNIKHEVSLINIIILNLNIINKNR